MKKAVVMLIIDGKEKTFSIVESDAEPFNTAEVLDKVAQDWSGYKDAFFYAEKFLNLLGVWCGYFATRHPLKEKRRETPIFCVSPPVTAAVILLSGDPEKDDGLVDALKIIYSKMNGIDKSEG